MEDDSKLGSHRFVRIDVTDPECVRRWAEQFQVSEAEVRAAQRWAARKLRLVVEPGGSVGLAALLAGKVDPTPDTLLVLSGGNADPEDYAKVLAGTD